MALAFLSLLLEARRNDRRGINTTVGRRHVFGDQTLAVAAHALEHWIRDLCANQPVNRVLEWCKTHTATSSSWRRVDGVEIDHDSAARRAAAI